MLTNRRQFVSGATLALPLWLTACQASDISRDQFGVVDAAANSMVADRLTPGLSISVMREGELIYSKAFGYGNLETASLMTPQSVFKIASITKQMTAAAILRLAEDKHLSLSDPVSTYVPEFPKAGEMTLYQLATHTAGLGSFNRLPSRGKDRLVTYDDEGYLELLLKTDPMFVAAPGERESYSNTGYGLLGLVISRVTRAHYTTYFNEQLFPAAELKNTRFDNPLAVIKNRVDGYSPNAEAPGGFEQCGYTSATYTGPAGGVISTTEDLCAWHQALVFGGLLQKESLQRMLAPVETKAGLSFYGMGVRTKFSRPPFEGRSVVSHGGRILGFAADLWSFPEKRVTVATLMNSDGGDRDDFGRRFDSIRDPATQIALGEFAA